MARAIQKYIFIIFGQVFQGYGNINAIFATFWYGLLPNMAISRDSG